MSHVWFWRKRLPEFEDGYRVVTSRYAVRRRLVRPAHKEVA